MPGPSVPLLSLPAARLLAPVLAVLALAPAAVSVAAEDDARNPWRLCGPLRLAGEIVADTAAVSPAERAGQPTELDADEIESNEDSALLRGDVRVRRADQSVEAESLRYQRSSGEISADTGLLYRAGTLAISARAAQLNLEQDGGVLEDVEFALGDRHVRGGARRLELEGPDFTRLTDFTYTTCNADEEAWLMRGSEIELDRAEGFGTARHARVELVGIPVLYLPYIKFPISDRRLTGFLLPSIGSSSESGAELRLPYYLNLAPNYDLTLTPRLLEKRGFMLGSEFRYLTANASGELELDYLPEDRDFDDQERGLLVYDHRARWRSGWSADASIEYASDREYFEDLGETLSVASITHLEQRADLAYRGPIWSLRGRVQSFQTIDLAIAEIDEPYRRLPQLTLGLSTPLRAAGMEFSLAGEWVDFYHPLKLRGSRLDVEPAVALPLRAPWGFLIPRLAARHTAYRLDEVFAPAAPEPSRDLYTFSIDTGLFFERSLGGGERGYIQTLEPRLFYLKVPLRAQDELPVFDTTEPDISFSSLFRTNRFAGADRVGDAQQLTLALTSRILDQASGGERLRASVGQIQYFRDREVTLPGEPVATATRSEVIAELAAQLSRAWSARLTSHWDPVSDRGSRNSLHLQYRPDGQHILNIAYRFQRDVLEQSDLSLRWPFGERWHAVARWNYSLRDERDLESFLGLEYESCCWAVRVVGRRFINDADGQTNERLMVQFVLKGLGKFGGGVEGVLERGILGYPQEP